MISIIFKTLGIFRGRWRQVVGQESSWWMTFFGRKSIEETSGIGENILFLA